jgi:hypothetical protein
LAFFNVFMLKTFWIIFLIITVFEIEYNSIILITKKDGSIYKFFI